jgi:hypothetical protein
VSWKQETNGGASQSSNKEKAEAIFFVRSLCSEWNAQRFKRPRGHVPFAAALIWQWDYYVFGPENYVNNADRIQSKYSIGEKEKMMIVAAFRLVNFISICGLLRSASIEVNGRFHAPSGHIPSLFTYDPLVTPLFIVLSIVNLS